jgi:hypothetical protein
MSNPAPAAQSAFNAAYWASFPPQVAALQGMAVDANAPSPGGRTITAMGLATQGFIIDTPIMIWGWDPYLTMTYRQQFGFTWVPSALQAAPTIAPGVSQPGVQPYNPNNPPPGSIKVSTNLADYPPYSVPPPAQAITQLVGAQIVPGVNKYFPVYGDTSPAGTFFTDSRGKFEKFSTPPAGPMGMNPSYWWELIQPAMGPIPAPS